MGSSNDDELANRIRDRCRNLRRRVPVKHADLLAYRKGDAPVAVVTLDAEQWLG